MNTMQNGSDICRATGLLVIEVINSNPNGDPDRESDPRQRPDGKGEISPVSFKRKLRDLVELKEGQVWKQLAQELGLDPSGFHVLESRGRDREAIIKEVLNDTFIGKYWDGRVFGNTFLEKQKKAGEGGDEQEQGTEGKPKGKTKGKKLTPEQLKVMNSIKTGVVQFGLGLSIAPVAIERMTNTNKAGVQEGKDRGMAPLGYRVVDHGVYCMPFFVNPTASHKTGCTTADIELMLRLIPRAYPHTASYVRPMVEIRHAWYIVHRSVLGSYSDFALLKALTPRKKTEPDRPSTCWEDYEVPTQLPPELAIKVQPLRDLVEEAYAAPGT